ncbi:MAG TPA: YbaK/EbsC family protein [Planctomycetota bacterium]|nr:YbaK/EbsC family protein [Planctomycetota bacterium]
MVVATKLKAFLDARKVVYQVLKHHERFTSQEIAEALHVPGRMLAKVVIAKADGTLRMAVLPGDLRLDLKKFAKAAAAKEAALATEAEFRDAFPDCEIGAMPPFGNLYAMRVIVDKALAADEQIVFEAGNHHEAIKLLYADFARLVVPQVADIARAAAVGSMSG